MNDPELIRKSRSILSKGNALPAKERFQRLVEKGVVDEKGEVKLWDANLAVVGVKRKSGGKQIDYFRCLMPVFGMPGTAQVDMRRESLIKEIKDSNKRVITAYLDKHRNRWQEGEDIHVTSHGYVRTDANEIDEDNLGELPEFHSVNSRL